MLSHFMFVYLLHIIATNAGLFWIRNNKKAKIVIKYFLFHFVLEFTYTFIENI